MKFGAYCFWDGITFTFIVILFSTYLFFLQPNQWGLNSKKVPLGKMLYHDLAIEAKDWMMNETKEHWPKKYMWKSAKTNGEQQISERMLTNCRGACCLHGTSFSTIRRAKRRLKADIQNIFLPRHLSMTSHLFSITLLNCVFIFIVLSVALSPLRND